MVEESFRDYYEVLQLSPNADSETIERVFRLLAKRYHPDNNRTGDTEKFNLLSEAFRVLSDPEKRAAYDVRYDKTKETKWQIIQEALPSDDVEADRKIQQRTLSLLYVTRRRDALNPGVGIFELERLLGCPEKHMEFHIWYLKEKGWIQRTDSGEFAITVSGIDVVRENNLLLRRDQLLPAETESHREGRKSEHLPQEGKVRLNADIDASSSGRMEENEDRYYFDS
jgi:curved DNA-binding protein CbpA